MDYQPAFNRWLAEVLPEEPLANVRAYNFNIAETMMEYVVEIVGASAFDPSNSDWACDDTWSCRPSEFLLLQADFGSKWKSAETYVAGLVQEFLQHGPSSKARLLRESEAVAVGFVDGDLVYVWPEGMNT